MQHQRTYKSEADILLVQQKRVVFTVETVDCEVEKEFMIGVDHDEQCSLIAADVVRRLCHSLCVNGKNGEEMCKKKCQTRYLYVHEKNWFY